MIISRFKSLAPVLLDEVNKQTLRKVWQVLSNAATITLWPQRKGG